MELIENIPLNTHVVANLIEDRHDLYLVWPLARFPFDHDQWREVLDPEKGNVPLLIQVADTTVGHAALRKTEEDRVYVASFLFLLPQFRDKGLGKQLIALLEQYAKENLSAKRLTLVVRDYNPRALNCYLKCGFQEIGRSGTLITMSKELHDDFD